MTRIEWLQLPGETLESDHLPGVADAAEVGKAGKNSERGGKRQSESLEADGNFGGQDGTGRRAINSNVVRLVGFQQLSIDRDNIIYSGGERILPSGTRADRDDINPPQLLPRGTLTQPARVGTRTSTGKIDQHCAAIPSAEAV